MSDALRPARAGEDVDVAALAARAYAPWTAMFGAPPVPVTEDYAARLAAGQIWVLERDGAVAASLVLERHPDHAMIFSLAVDPALHGTGLGSVLLGFAEAEAQRWGTTSLRLYTNARMERNIAIYGARGFVETGRRPHPKRPAFTIVDMEKRLTTA